MKKSKRFIPVIAALFVIIIFAVTLNVTHIWKNYKYRIFAGHHLRLSDGNKSLFWFDAVHSNNPRDIMFKDLESLLTENTPDLVLVEGGYDTFQGNRESAIAEGESAFAAYIAKQNGIIVENIEPPFAKQIEYLQTKYDPDEILAMYLLRQIGSQALMPEESNAHFYDILKNMTHFLIQNGLNYQNANIENILAVLNRFLPEPINDENWHNLKVYRIYAKNDGIIHTIYDDVTSYRNIYLVELIQQKSRYGKIFIVMGGQHLKDTKKKLQEMYAH